MSRGVLRWLHESGTLEAVEQRLTSTKAKGRRRAVVSDVEFWFELVEASVRFGPLHYVSVSGLGWIDKRGDGRGRCLRSDRLRGAPVAV